MKPEQNLQPSNSLNPQAQICYKSLSNPYTFTCGRLNVSVHFSPDGKDASDALCEYFLRNAPGL